MESKNCKKINFSVKDVFGDEVKFYGSVVGFDVRSRLYIDGVRSNKMHHYSAANCQYCLKVLNYAELHFIIGLINKGKLTKNNYAYYLIDIQRFITTYLNNKNGFALFHNLFAQHYTAYYIQKALYYWGRVN